MTVFIAHAAPDRAAAEALEKYLERRGLFAEIEDGAQPFRTTQGADTVVALWSRQAGKSPQAPMLERRARDAAGDGRLVLVALDRAPAPLRLPAIDASVATQRDMAWAAVTKRVENGPQPVAPAPEPPPARRRGPPLLAIGALALCAAMAGLAVLQFDKLSPLFFR